MSENSEALSDWEGYWGSNELLAGLKMLRSSGPPPDFTLIAEGHEFPVHKVILFCHSDVLYKMSTNAAFMEGQTGRAELKDVKACHVGAMVEHMYGSGSSPKTKQQPKDIFSQSTTTEEPSTAEYTMAMIMLAEQYNVVGLKIRAEHFMKYKIEVISQNAGKFAALVERIYENEDLPSYVLDHAIYVACQRLECLYLDDPASLVETRPEFALSVLKKLVEQVGERQERCDKRRKRRAASESTSSSD